MLTFSFFLLLFVVSLNASSNKSVISDIQETTSASSTQSKCNLPSIFSNISWCCDEQNPLCVEVKSYLKPGKLPKLVKLLQSNDLSSQPWASFLYAEALEQNNFNAFSLLTAYDVASKVLDYKFTFELMEWCIKYSRWNYLNLFIFKKDLCRVPLKDGLILLHRGIPQDLTDVVLIALENDSYTKEEIYEAFELAIENKSTNVLRILLDAACIESCVKNQIIVKYLLSSTTAYKGLIGAGVPLSVFVPEFLIFLLQNAAKEGFCGLTETILRSSNLTDYLNSQSCEKPWFMAQAAGHEAVVQIYRNFGYHIHTLAEALQVQNYILAEKVILEAGLTEEQVAEDAFNCLEKNDLPGLQFLLSHYVPITVLKNGKSLLIVAMLLNDFSAVQLLMITYDAPIQSMFICASTEMINFVGALVYYRESQKH